MKMTLNVLTLDKSDCEAVQNALEQGVPIKSFLSEEIRDMYQGDIDALEGIEIPADYWHFVMELDADRDTVSN